MSAEQTAAQFALCRWCIAGIMLPVTCMYFVAFAWMIGG